MTMKIIAITFAAITLTACSKEKEKETVSVPAKEEPPPPTQEAPTPTAKEAPSISAQVQCETFNLKASIQGDSLTFSLDTDLPEDTSVMVTISRGYRLNGGYQQKGGTERYPLYSLNYYSSKAKVSELKIPKTIILDNRKWFVALDARQEELSKVGLRFEVWSVLPSVELKMEVPIRQDNPAFGKNNSNLTGKVVTKAAKTGFNVVTGEATFNYKFSP